MPHLHNKLIFSSSLVYVDVGLPSTASAKLEFTFSSTVTTISRSWEIKVTQIECTSTSKPYDSGCLQYFTGTTGRLTSFNFAQSSSALYGQLNSQVWVIFCWKSKYFLKTITTHDLCKRLRKLSQHIKKVINSSL